MVLGVFFSLCNSETLNTNVLPRMLRSHLNQLSPGLMLSNSTVPHFPVRAQGHVCLPAQPRTRAAACDGGPGTLAWPPFRSQPRHIPKTLKISCKASPGCACPADQACACCESWEANGPTDSLRRLAAHANEFRVLLQWMAIKEGLMKAEPVGMDRLCGCEESCG